MKKSKNERMLEILSLAPVVPVLVIEDAAVARPLAQALVEGGLPVIEVTMRTPHALAAIEDIRKHVDGAVVGAGTVVSPAMARDCVDAGCEFLVSPGTTASFLKVASKVDIPTLPGVVTPSEAMALAEEGFETVKFFPAEAAGGVDYLRALASPLPHITFCPTGGIGATQAADYLALPNVAAVGGSWVAPRVAIANGDWERIRDLAAQAAALGQSMGTAHV